VRTLRASGVAALLVAGLWRIAAITETPMLSARRFGQWSAATSIDMFSMQHRDVQRVGLCSGSRRGGPLIAPTFHNCAESTKWPKGGGA